MADFNQIFDAGDYQNGTIIVVVEIPAGSNHKIEWDRRLGVMKLDRVEPQIFASIQALQTIIAKGYLPKS